MKSLTNKMTLVPFVLMVFTAVFGFANISRAFFLMGYSAIPWYIFSTIVFFVPFAFMMAEYGSAFKHQKGGIYSWMEKSVGPRYAFIATFMWYSSYMIWMVNIGSTIWVVGSNAVFGQDLTYKLSFFGMTSSQSLAILAVLFMTVVTFVATKGLKSITKATSIGGLAVGLLNLVLLFGAILILILNKGQLAQPIVSLNEALFVSPHPAYQTYISQAAFMVFALFAFGGIEVIGGLADKTENAEKTLPKGIIISSIIIVLGYCLGIFLVGIFINWQDVMGKENVTIANAAYIVMQNLGYQIGLSLGYTEERSISLGYIMSRYMGISMFLALTGAFFALIYSPLKQLIEGTPKEMWPFGLAESKDGMPVKAMWAQCFIVIIFIFAVAFGGKSAYEFFMKITLMTNVAMTLPYIFIAFAFPYFKANKDIVKPFVIFKSQRMANIGAFFSVVSVGLACLITVIEPSVVSGNYSDTIWMSLGPVIFATIAMLIYKNYEKKLLS